MNEYVPTIEEQYGSNVANIYSLANATGITELGYGTYDGTTNADSYSTFYAMHSPQGDIRFATTNGDPLWEDEDAQAFAELAEQCGVEL